MVAQSLQRSPFNPYRYESTTSLKTNLETRLWDRAEIVADLEVDSESWSGGKENVAFCDVQITLIVQELDRRERLRRRTDSPSWTMGSTHLGPDKDAVKAALRIEDYLDRRGIPMYRHRSGRVTCICPLPGHDDASPSFDVNTEKQLWRCHGCCRGGDIFSLHQHMIGDPDFFRTVTELADEAGIEIGSTHAK